MNCAISNPGGNMYVFRDGRRSVGGAELTLGLKGALLRWRAATGQDSEDCLLAALIAAGELECALLDSSEAGRSLPDDFCGISPRRSPTLWPRPSSPGAKIHSRQFCRRRSSCASKAATRSPYRRDLPTTRCTRARWQCSSGNWGSARASKDGSACWESAASEPLWLR